MPQMKPMYWTSMLLMISLLLTIIITIMYYSTYPFMNEIYKKNSLTNKKMYWIWKW